MGMAVSVSAAALAEASADAARTDSDHLIFHDAWKPTMGYRNSTTQPQSRPRPWAPGHIPPWAKHSLNPPGLPELPKQWPRRHQHHRPPLPTTLPASVASPERPKEDAVAKLLEDNHDVFYRLINHPFPRALGDGSASLDGFRYYMIQDTLYLETCACLKMVAAAHSPFKYVENFGPRHASSLKYVENSKEILISELGVSKHTIDTTPPSKQFDANDKYHRLVIRDKDALLAYYVALLPCVLSYWKIAERLMESPSTVQNVVYYEAWIKINNDRSHADKYIEFINANIMAKGGPAEWNHIFRTACMLEADLFDTGLQAPTPYQIVPNGTYSIQNSSTTEGVVLNAGSSVIGVNKTGGNNEKWHVVATKDGYTFRNVGTGHYLGIATREEGQILQAVINPCYWWINPVRSQPSRGSLLYQIYESRNLRYTLHADIEAPKSVNHVEPTNLDHTPIITHDNFKGDCQMWSFELEQLDLPAPVLDLNETGKPGPRTVSKPEAGDLCVPPNSQSPPSPRFLYYGVYNEAGASVSKGPIDSERPWLSKINLDLIPPPVSVASILHLLSMKEDITTFCQLFSQDGLTRLNNGNWFGTTTENHVVLKYTSQSQLPTFTEGSHYEIQNCHTLYSLGLDRSTFRAEKPGFGHRDKPCTLKLQGDGGVSFRFQKHGKWAGPGFCASEIEHSFCFIPSMTNQGSFFICEDPTSRKAFYDPGNNQRDREFNLELKDLDPTEKRQMWCLIPSLWEGKKVVPTPWKAGNNTPP